MSPSTPIKSMGIRSAEFQKASGNITDTEKNFRQAPLRTGGKSFHLIAPQVARRFAGKPHIRVRD